MPSREQARLIALPVKTQTTLFLIEQELKMRKLFRMLQKIGVNECDFHPHLDSVILRGVGMDDGKDESYEFFNEILERRSRKIDADHRSVVKQAMKVYMELVNKSSGGAC